MDSDNNNQDNADSAAALKDLTAELESLKASDLAAETASDAATTTGGEAPTEESSNITAPANDESISEPTTEPEPSVSTEEEVAAELPDKPNLEIPTEPIIPDEPTSPEPTSDPASDTSNIPGEAVADFTEMSTEESSSEEEKAEEKENLPPIKPAAPVPGSIGSAKSYEDYQTDEANRAEKEAIKSAKAADRAARESSAKKTSSTGLILGVVVAIIVVVVAVIFAVVIITNKPKNKVVDYTNIPPEEETPALSSITCTKAIKDAELTALGQADEANVTFTATYYDDELNEMSEKTVIEYATVDDANNNATMLKDAYQSTLALIGLEKDPFNSTYPVSGTTLTISHVADAEDIDEKNFAIFGLQVDAENKVKTAIKDIEKLYTDKDYTCVVE